MTGPVERFAGNIASEGYVVALPSSFHEFEGPEAIPYDVEGTDRGNKYKVGGSWLRPLDVMLTSRQIEKTVDAYDEVQLPVSRHKLTSGRDPLGGPPHEPAQLQRSYRCDWHVPWWPLGELHDTVQADAQALRVGSS